LVHVEQRWQPERRAAKDGDAVDFGNGVVLPALIERTVSDKTLPYDVLLTLTFQEERYEVAALRFGQKPGGEPVSGQRLRQVAVDRLVRQVMSEFLPRRKPRTPGVRKLIRQAEVVSIYRLAFALHLPPTKTVSDRIGISQGSAEQAVIAARAAGRLPATEQGRAKG
jgi:hypothetical protein